MNSDIMFLNIIGKLIKKEVKIEINGQVLEFKPAKEIKISDSFFRDFTCQRCDNGCCAKTQTDLIWMDEYYDLPKNIKQYLVIKSIKVNGKEKYLYIYKQEKPCRFFRIDEINKKSTCLIHNIKPILCEFTPIWIDKIGNKIIIHKRIIKRNWRYGCRMKLTKINLQEDINKLNKLKNVADYLEIETYIGEIINYLKKNEQKATTIT